MSAKIFISFASQDQKVAMTLCSALESRGFQCWISSRDILPGENFQSAIVRAIREAKIMLLVFTANSNNSEEMNKELALASQSKIIVVPLRIEDVRPNDAFAYEFATRQWVDFFADWELAIQQLAHRIENATREADSAAQSIPAEPEAASPPVEAANAEPIIAPADLVPPAPEAVAVEAAIAAQDDDLAGAAALPGRRRRTGFYIAISVIALLVASLAVIVPNLTRPKTPSTEPRVMAVVRAPAAAQPAATEALQPAALPPEASPATDTQEAVAEPAPKKKKKIRTVAPIDDVPY